MTCGASVRGSDDLSGKFRGLPSQFWSDFRALDCLSDEVRRSAGGARCLSGEGERFTRRATSLGKGRSARSTRVMPGYAAKALHVLPHPLVPHQDAA